MATVQSALIGTRSGRKPALIMPRVSGTVFPFPAFSGNSAYSIKFAVPNPNEPFSFSLGNSGVDPDAGGLGTPAETTGMYFLSFSGVSGKLYDTEENYIHSYGPGEYTSVNGNIFSGYHNYFINNIPVNLNASRRTGEFNSVFVGNISQSQFKIGIDEKEKTVTATGDS